MTKLQSVYFPKNMTSLKYIGDGCFNNIYTSLTTIYNLPDSIEYIGTNAFKWCQKLQLNKLPNSLKYIGVGAFYGCYEVTFSTIPHGCTQLLDSVF
jgi:hypothetical protein